MSPVKIIDKLILLANKCSDYHTFSLTSKQYTLEKRKVTKSGDVFWHPLVI